MKQNRNGMKQNGDGTFSHDPYPLITERNTFKRTETDARQLLENESLSALSTLRNTLEKVQASDRKKALEKLSTLSMKRKKKKKK